MLATIVMPTWRQEAFIEDALEGLYLQSLQDFQLIVVIDGEAERYPELDLPGVNSKVIELQTNHGTAEALNRGFAEAEGELYWTWVSSDNVHLTPWLETLATYLDESTVADAVYSDYVREAGRMTRDGWHGAGRRYMSENNVGLIHSEACYIGPSFLYHRSLHERVGPHRGGISHDYDWWLRAEELGTIHHFEKTLCTYRSHDGRCTIVKRDQYDAPKWQREAVERRSGR